MMTAKEAAGVGYYQYFKDHPYLVSAAPYPSQPDLKAIWPTLVLEDVDLYIAGHNQAYERLARIRTQGNVDEDWGRATATTATPGCRPSWSGPGAAR